MNSSMQLHNLLRFAAAQLKWLYHPVSALSTRNLLFLMWFSKVIFLPVNYHLSTIVQAINCPSDCKIFTIEAILSPSAQKWTLLSLKYGSRQAVEISSQALSLGWRVYDRNRPKLVPTIYKIPWQTNNRHISSQSFPPKVCSHTNFVEISTYHIILARVLIRVHTCHVT